MQANRKETQQHPMTNILLLIGKSIETCCREITTTMREEQDTTRNMIKELIEEVKSTRNVTESMMINYEENTSEILKQSENIGEQVKHAIASNISL